MRNIFRFFVFIFLLGSGFFLSAQNQISFGVNGVQHQDTLSMGDSIHFSFWLVNSGSLVITDSIFMSCETFDNIGGSISSMEIGGSYNASLNLAPGDSIFINISEIITVQSYMLGDNIIVIWPASINSDADTSFTEIHILGSVSSTNQLIDSNNELLIYPNPSAGYFTLSNTLNLEISDLQIFDSNGKILYYNEGVYDSRHYFNFDKLPCGRYFVRSIVGGEVIVKNLLLNR